MSKESSDERRRRKRLAFIIKCLSFILLVFGLLGLGGVFSSGCDKKNTQAQHRTERGRKIISDLEFRKHAKSGLCFAIYGEAHGAVMANVPCERVKHLLPKGEK